MTFAQLEEGRITFTNSVLNCVDGDYDTEGWFLGQEGNAVGDAALTNAFDFANPDYTPTTMGTATAGDAQRLILFLMQHIRWRSRF